MKNLYLPVRPDLWQLKNEAEDLLGRIRDREPDSLADLAECFPEPLERIGLKHARQILARRYGLPDWFRLAGACRLIEAIWNDDPERVRSMIARHPRLLSENARGTQNCNWGPPMSYAANLGRNRIISLLIDLGATDFEQAIGRAILQSKIETAELLHRAIGSPPPPPGALAGPAYTLSVAGTEFALRLGAPVKDGGGSRLAPVDVVLETDSRNPAAKHAILELYVEYGLELPDTPVMALHRGRLDLLERHMQNDPGLIDRTFSHEEIYPPELGCHDEVLATQGTPLAGTSLLHLCADYDELEIARWLLDKGADVNVRSTVDEDGFGGYSPLFATVVSQPNFWMNYQDRPRSAPLTELFLQYGADPGIRGSLRKKLHPGYGPKYETENYHEYRNVTALEWGERFHARVFVNEKALEVIKKYSPRV